MGDVESSIGQKDWRRFNIHRAVWSASIRNSTRDLSRIGELWRAGCFALTRWKTCSATTLRISNPDARDEITFSGWLADMIVHGVFEPPDEYTE